MQRLAFGVERKTVSDADAQPATLNKVVPQGFDKLSPNGWEVWRFALSVQRGAVIQRLALSVQRRG